jgi:transaldolase/glucose-6-phosphate isomerase
MNPIQRLGEVGQSVWLDYIRRDLLRNGDLVRLVDEGVRGVTSNPSIFEKAIAGSDDYDEALAAIISDDLHVAPMAAFEELAVGDIQDAADILAAVYESSDGADGFVSLEVSPELARDTERTVAEARRLWKAVARSNVMIKVPATPPGIGAIETLIAEGINVNATLIFSLGHYEAVAQAYRRGLEKAPDPARVASVASFFVSRVDTAVDRRLSEVGSDAAVALRGSIAVANAKLAYARYQELFEGEGFSQLAARGARPQRVLWASTGTKNPTYSDVLYVEELVGANTVNTVPPATLELFREHGVIRGSTLTEDVDDARSALDRLAGVGVDLDDITAELQDEGVEAFAASYHDLLHSIDEKARRLGAGRVDTQTLELGALNGAVTERLDDWAAMAFTRRLWAKDHTLWTADPQPEISDRLGWLTLPETMHDIVDDLEDFAGEVRRAGFRHAVLLGMGGSSLAPEVYQRTFGNRKGYPELIVLDSTHPDAVAAVDKRIDPSATLFIVASKSGTTLEPLSFFRFFWSRVAAVSDSPGDHFVAVTDPDTPLVDLARERGFRKIFEATPDVGGRYSALTAFGLVPAAIIGIDVHKVLDRSWRMSESAAFCVSEGHNPSLAFGAALGVAATNGRDKATFLVSPSLAAFPAWVEQLIAESTGKDDTGILPVAGEPAGAPEVYGGDRLFVYLNYVGDSDTSQAAALDALQAAGHPVVRITMHEREDLGAEMFRAEFAVAAASAVLGIHPFNQPDVELAKDLARQAMAGELAGEDIDEISVDDTDALHQAIAEWLATAASGDYISLQAYLQPTPETDVALARIRVGLRDQLRVATTSGYGPRFLHSTGQFHKGGPNAGLFLQLVDHPVAGVDVPETDYTFGELIAAQAIGDYQALRARDRRVLRIALGRDSAAGLALLEDALAEAMDTKET